ncbi:TniQ family protein [Caldibacillus thermoamylovorans]
MNAILDRLLENGEHTDFLEHLLSTRSVLYNLEPVGIGTPYVESLTSYISRLAFTHNVTVSSLLKGTVVPMADKKYLKNNLSEGVFGSTPKYINGNSQVSQDYVKVFEILTGRNDLCYLTMVSWTGIFSQNIIGNYRKWCPVCLNRMIFESKEVYEPLIWYLADINKCDVHDTLLEDKCPNCKRRLDFMYSNFTAGHCPYCSTWLGDCNSKKEPLNEAEKFIHVNYQQLIKMAPSLLSFPTKNSSSIILRRIMDMLGFDSIRKFAKFLEVDSSGLSMWMSNKHIPSRKSLLQIVKKLDITIYEYFYKESLNIKKNAVKTVDIQGENKIKSKEEIEYILKKEIKSEVSKSIYQISREYNFNYMTAKKHFPELCKIITGNYSSYKKEQIKKKQVDIENKLIDAFKKVIPISLSEFSKVYGVPVATAKRYAPELCKQLVDRYKNYVAEQKRERIEKNSTEIKNIAIALHRKGIYPSIKRIQKEISDPNIFIKGVYRDKWREIIELLGY